MIRWTMVPPGIPCATDTEVRAALVRALTAQAWAVACEMFNAGGAFVPPDCVWPDVTVFADNVSRLPSPAALADDLLGIPPR